MALSITHTSRKVSARTSSAPRKLARSRLKWIWPLLRR
ncbi:hypothetical protein ANCCAN_07816 [Ancylostoma caninum]|uniref:Uncharacterized protein n=1 Tax=Ancylostoma caninum TaxID=29170 RepID=A0A368GT76_ANCCA|nr:hypothetical protein ANCCAN_07816 [Ancylostoma caninum]